MVSRRTRVVTHQVPNIRSGKRRKISVPSGSCRATALIITCCSGSVWRPHDVTRHTALTAARPLVEGTHEAERFVTLVDRLPRHAIDRHVGRRSCRSRRVFQYAAHGFTGRKIVCIDDYRRSRGINSRVKHNHLISGRITTTRGIRVGDPIACENTLVGHVTSGMGRGTGNSPKSTVGGPEHSIASLGKLRTRNTILGGPRKSNRTGRDSSIQRIGLHFGRHTVSRRTRRVAQHIPTVFHIEVRYSRPASNATGNCRKRLAARPLIHVTHQSRGIVARTCTGITCFPRHPGDRHVGSTHGLCVLHTTEREGISDVIGIHNCRRRSEEQPVRLRSGVRLTGPVGTADRLIVQTAIRVVTGSRCGEENRLSGISCSLTRNRKGFMRNPVDQCIGGTRRSRIGNQMIILRRSRDMVPRGTRACTHHIPVLTCVGRDSGHPSPSGIRTRCRACGADRCVVGPAVHGTVSAEVTVSDVARRPCHSRITATDRHLLRHDIARHPDLLCRGGCLHTVLTSCGSHYKCPPKITQGSSGKTGAEIDIDIELEQFGTCLSRRGMQFTVRCGSQRKTRIRKGEFSHRERCILIQTQVRQQDIRHHLNGLRHYSARLTDHGLSGRKAEIRILLSHIIRLRSATRRDNDIEETLRSSVSRIIFRGIHRHSHLSGIHTVYLRHRGRRERHISRSRERHGIRGSDMEDQRLSRCSVDTFGIEVLRALQRDIDTCSLLRDHEGRIESLVIRDHPVIGHRRCSCTDIGRFLDRESPQFTHRVTHTCGIAFERVDKSVVTGVCNSSTVRIIRRQRVCTIGTRTGSLTIQFQHEIGDRRPNLHFRGTSGRCTTSGNRHMIGRIVQELRTAEDGLTRHFGPIHDIERDIHRLVLIRRENIAETVTVHPCDIELIEVVAQDSIEQIAAIRKVETVERFGIIRETVTSIVIFTTDHNRHTVRMIVIADRSVIGRTIDISLGNVHLHRDTVIGHRGHKRIVIPHSVRRSLRISGCEERIRLGGDVQRRSIVAVVSRHQRIRIVRTNHIEFRQLERNRIVGRRIVIPIPLPCTGSGVHGRCTYTYVHTYHSTIEIDRSDRSSARNLHTSTAIVEHPVHRDARSGRLVVIATIHDCVDVSVECPHNIIVGDGRSAVGQCVEHRFVGRHDGPRIGQHNQFIGYASGLGTGQHHTEVSRTSRRSAVHVVLDGSRNSFPDVEQISGRVIEHQDIDVIDQRFAIDIQKTGRLRGEPSRHTQTQQHVGFHAVGREDICRLDIPIALTGYSGERHKPGKKCKD